MKAFWFYSQPIKTICTYSHIHHHTKFCELPPNLWWLNLETGLFEDFCNWPPEKISNCGVANVCMASGLFEIFNNKFCFLLTMMMYLPHYDPSTFLSAGQPVARTTFPHSASGSQPGIHPLPDRSQIKTRVPRPPWCRDRTTGPWRCWRAWRHHNSTSSIHRWGYMWYKKQILFCFEFTILPMNSILCLPFGILCFHKACTLTIFRIW